MNTVQSNKKKYIDKKCQFVGCTNIFLGSQFEKYCKDPRCIEIRLLTRKKREVKIDPEVDNLILKSNIYGIRLGNKKMLQLRCRAKDYKGIRCGKSFSILFEKGRDTYPKFCPNHRNTYKRKLFEKGMFDANNQTF